MAPTEFSVGNADAEASLDCGLSFWRAHWSDENPNGTWQRIWRLTWGMVCFRSVNEAVRLAIESGMGVHHMSGIQQNLLVHSFLSSQCVQIRSLYSPYGGVRGDKSVHSVGALLRDFEQNAHLVDETYLQAAGIVGSGIRPQDVFFEYWTGRGVVSPDLYREINAGLKQACAKVVQYANKHIAHLATTESLQGNAVQSPSVLDLVDANRSFVKVACFVDRALIGGPEHMPLPLSQHDIVDECACLVQRETYLVGLLDSYVSELFEEVLSWAHTEGDGPLSLVRPMMGQGCPPAVPGEPKSPSGESC